MDEKLIQEITREVVRRLAGTETPAAASPAPKKTGGAAGKVLAIFTGGDQNLDAAYAQVRAVRDSGAEVVLVLSPAAVQIVGTETIRRGCGGARVITSWRDFGGMRELLRDVRGLLVPVLTLNTLAKVALLQGDSLAANLIVQALLRGLPVVAASDSLICCDAHGGASAAAGTGSSIAAADATNPPAGVRAKLDQLHREAAALGLAIVPAGQLAAAFAAGGRPAPAGGSGAAAAAAAPAPAALTAGLVVGDKVVSVCTGSPADCAGCGQCVTNLPQRVGAVVSAGAARVGASLGIGQVPKDLAGMIDHTLLKAAATQAEIDKLCAEAKQYGFASVCVNTHWVKTCAELLKGSPVMVCTVVGFPLGAMSTAGKAAETMTAVQDGAQEIDMVLNIGALKSGDRAAVKNDIAAVVQAAGGRTVKVILETALLTDKEKVIACQLAKEAGAHFVKTSTGFGPGGATIADIALMRQTVGPEMGVKASGGIRDREITEDMIRAGATRVGASASIAIVQGKPAAAGSGY